MTPYEEQTPDDVNRRCVHAVRHVVAPERWILATAYHETTHRQSVPHDTAGVAALALVQAALGDWAGPG